MEAKKKITKTILYILLICLALFMLVPFYWMVISSLKLNKDVFSIPMRWWPETMHPENYSTIWKKLPLLTFFKNTADPVYNNNSAVHQLFRSIWFHKMSLQRKRYSFPDVCYYHCRSVAGIHGSSVHPGF